MLLQVFSQNVGRKRPVQMKLRVRFYPEDVDEMTDPVALVNFWCHPLSHTRGHCSWLCHFQLFCPTGTSLSETHLLTTVIEEYGRPLRSCDIIFRVISATHCSYCMQCLGCEWVIIFRCHQSRIHRQIAGGICAVPTADTVATGEVNWCNYVVQHSPALQRWPARSM